MNKVYLIYENNCVTVVPFVLPVFHFQSVPFRNVLVYPDVTEAAVAAASAASSEAAAVYPSN